MIVRSTLCLCATLAFLTSCGGSQPQIGAPGAMPQSRAIAQHAARGKSWMLQEARGNDLLYISNNTGRDVAVFSYPKGKLIGTLSGFSNPAGECVDKAGNVFITDSAFGSGAGTVSEYAHGGSAPIAELSVPFDYPNGCAVDPTSGDLAVSAIRGLAVFPHASGTPTTFTDPSFQSMNYAGYDDAGNLYVDGDAYGGGFVFAELPRNGSALVDISVTGSFRGSGAVQWDGHYMTVQTISSGRGEGRAIIYQLQITGSTASVVGTTTLLSNKNRSNGGQFWIQGGRVIGPDKSGNSVGLWRYPSGGKGTKSVKSFEEAWGVTVSRAPHL